MADKTRAEALTESKLLRQQLQQKDRTINAASEMVGRLVEALERLRKAASRQRFANVHLRDAMERADELMRSIQPKATPAKTTAKTGAKGARNQRGDGKTS